MSGQYDSGRNDVFLSVDQMRALIEQYVVLSHSVDR